MPSTFIPTRLNDLRADVLVENPIPSQVLTFDGNRWINQRPPAVSSASTDYQLSLNTAPPPVNGQIRLNNTDQTLVTAIYLHQISGTGADVTSVVLDQPVGTRIYIQDFNDATRWRRYIQTGPATDEGVYLSIPVTYAEGGLDLQAQKVAVIARGDAAGGLPVVDTTAIVKGSGDPTKQLRFEVDSFTAGQTRVLTPPDQDGTIAILELANVFTQTQSSPGAGASSERWGSGATAAGNYSTSLGNTASAAGNDGIAIGYSAAATGERGIAIGSTAQSRNGIYNIAIGGTAVAGLDGGSHTCIAIGYSSVATGFLSLALGTTAQATNTYAIAIGYGARVTSQFAMTIGVSSQVTANSGIALGFAASSTAEHGIALGGGAGAGHANSIALGYAATTTASNQLVIGAASVPINEMRFPTAGFNRSLTIPSADGTIALLEKAQTFTQPQLFQSADIAAIPTIIQGMVGQTASLTEWWDSTGAVAGYFKSAAGLNEFRVANGASSYIVFQNFGYAQQIAIGRSGMSTLLTFPRYGAIQTEYSSLTLALDVRYDDANYAWIYADVTRGVKILGGGSAGSGLVVTATGTVGINKTASITGQLHVQSAAAGTTTEVVQGFASQTANLQEWQSSTNAILATVSENGYLTTRKNAAPADAELAAGEAAHWFDATNGAAKVWFKGKTLDGTVVTAQVGGAVGMGAIVRPMSLVFVTGGKVFPNIHVCAGSTFKRIEGIGIMASLDGDAVIELAFPIPASLPTGTPKIKGYALAAAIAGSAKFDPKWKSIAYEEDPSALALNSEGTQTLSWGSGDTDQLKAFSVTLDADTVVAGEILCMQFTFLTASWTLAAVSTWVIWLEFE